MTYPKFAGALMALLALAATAADVGAQQKGKEKVSKDLAVVQIDDQIQIVQKTELAALKKQLQQQHKDAVANYKKRKADAKKAKEKFSEPAPKAKKLKVVKSGLDRDQAEELVKQLEAKRSNKSSKERTSKPAKKTGSAGKTKKPGKGK